MHVIKIPEKKIVKYLPEDLSECDSVQYIEICYLILLYQSGKINYEDFRVHALYKLLEMKPVNIGLFDENKYSRIYQLSELIDSFFEPGEEKVIKQYYIKNPIPSTLINLTKYFGPENEEDFTFGEYMDTLEAFLDFSETGEVEFLTKMFAINYRKTPFFKRSKRKNCLKYKGEINLNKFKHNHIGEFYGFYLYFASLNKYISSAKIFVQGSEIDLSIIFEGENEKSKHPGIGMKSILYALAESGIYGNMEQVRDTPLWEILVRMYDVTKAILDEKERLKKQTK